MYHVTLLIRKHRPNTHVIIMFSMLRFLPEPEKMDQSAPKRVIKKLHPMRACLKEAGKNLIANMPRLRKRVEAITNTMDQSLAGQTIIVTGASSGIGRVLAEDCAIRGARVILTCRDMPAGHRAMNQILSVSQNADLSVHHLDLSSFSSVRSFVHEIIDQEEKIDVLINNAAMIAKGRRVTEDEHEETIQVNYFSPVMLTMMLLDFMSSTSTDARIIFVSSLGHAFAKEIFLKDMDWKYFPTFRPLSVYYHSKLSVMLFVRELSKRADTRNVRVYAADPGFSSTGISRNLFPDTKVVNVLKSAGKPFVRTMSQAAASILSVLLFEKYGHDPDVYYFADGKAIPCSRVAQNDDKAAELWYLTKDLLDLPAMDLLPITSNV